MTNQDHQNVVQRLNEIASTPYVNDGTVTGISFDEANFKFFWHVNNYEDHLSDQTIRIDNLQDAIEIVYMFSKKDKDYLKEKFLENNFFSESLPLYLHFRKSI